MRWFEVSALQLLGVGLAACSQSPAAEPVARPKVVAPLPAPPSAPEVPKRPGLPSDDESTALRALGKTLGAPGGRLENPQALRSFFTRLDHFDAAPGPTVIAALGNSLIAGDKIVDVVRARLVAAFGDGGRGLLLADRMASYGPRNRSAAKVSGWKASTLAPPYSYRWPFGISGVHHTSQRAGAFSTFELRGETFAEIFWLDQPGAAAIDVRVDGTTLLTLRSVGKREGQRTRVSLPFNAEELTLVAQGRGAVIEGVALERPQTGIILEMLGVPSADASLFLDADEKIFEEQLHSRRPALVMLMFGGNETKRLAWGRSSAAKVDRDLRRLIHRVKSQTPACWVVGPIDSVTKKGRDPFVQRDELAEVIAIERKAAVEEGCAFFDLFSAMGGTGSVKRLDALGLMHKDYVHPRGQGLDLLGQLLADALFAAYDQAPLSTPTSEGD